MQKIILLVAIVSFLNSCKLTEKPEFVRIDKIDVVKADFNTVALKANAVFLNQNHLGGTLRTDNIDVLVDDNVIAKVSAEEFKVPAQDKFTIPLSVNIDTSKLVNSDKNGLLGSLVKQFLNKTVVVQFKGELAYTVVGYSSTYTIDHIEEIQIK